VDLRVVSVLPSATEIVCALGHASELVGRSEDCDFPRQVQRLPVVMRARGWNSGSSSSDIDARVQDARAQGVSLYEMDVVRLRELRPDLLLTQDLCGVCSVTAFEVEEACERAGVRPDVVSLTPQSLEDVWTSIEMVGKALGDGAAGIQLASRLRERSRASHAATPPQVALLEWLDLPIIAGLWVPEMVAAAGGVSLSGAPRSAGVRTSWAELGTAQPDLVVLSPCSFHVDRTEREASHPRIAEGLSRWTPRLGMFVADEAYFSRPGPRLAEGVELLRHLISGDDWDPPMPVRPLRLREVAA
jgi:iron complex transport system substrate-binding protein